MGFLAPGTADTAATGILGTPEDDDLPEAYVDADGLDVVAAAGERLERRVEPMGVLPAAVPVAILAGQPFEDERRASHDRMPARPGESPGRRAPAQPDANGSDHAPGNQGRPPGLDADRSAPVCTAPQLRRFIKSRAYVPMHELRRRFGIDGEDDDVTPVDLESGRLFVGLPGPEGQLLGDLLRAGEIGFELSMDPHTPIVVGVYAMRPVPRP